MVPIGQVPLLWAALAGTAAVVAGLACRDWPFLTRPVRTVQGRVVDFRTGSDDGHANYAAVIAFKANDGRDLEVVDGLLRKEPFPAVGSPVDLIYPDGLPQNARIARLGLRTLIYGFLLVLVALLLARVLELIS